MTVQPIAHATFVVERVYPVNASRVFWAFSDPAIKRQWFAEGEEWEVEEFTADFRVAGHELSRFRRIGGPPIVSDTRYLAITADQRIVFSYTMAIEDRPSSASLASVELFDAPGGTRLVYTEQGQYFDGADQALQRELGCGVLYDVLGEFLAAPPPRSLGRG